MEKKEHPHIPIPDFPSTDNNLVGKTDRQASPGILAQANFLDIQELNHLVGIVLSEFSSSNAGLTLEDFKKFILKYNSILDTFVNSFKEKLWKSSSLPTSRINKVPGCIPRSHFIVKKVPDSYVGSINVLNEHRLLKNLGVIREKMFSIYNYDEDQSLYDLIYLKGCYTKLDEGFGLFFIKIFHSTQYDVRLTLAFKTAEKREKWLNKITAAGEIRNFKDYYKLDKKIGDGKFSEVFVCEQEGTQKISDTDCIHGYSECNSKFYLTECRLCMILTQKFAVKMIKKRKLDRLEREMMKTEVSILKLVNHINIVKLVDTFFSQKYLYIVMEYASGGELFRNVNCGHIPEEIIKNIVFQILNAIIHIHSLGVIHRDIKPENILIEYSDDQLVVKIIDFGLAAFVGVHNSAEIPFGNLVFSAPEVLKKQTYDSKIDLWSLGVITYNLITGTLPFYDSDASKLVQKIVESEADYNKHIWNNYSSDSQNFVKNLLNKNSAERMTSSEALDHPWVRKFGNAE